MSSLLPHTLVPYPAATIAELSNRFSIISGRRWPVIVHDRMVGVRRGVRSSFRGSLRRYGSAEYSKRPLRHHNWIFRNGEWRIAFGKFHQEPLQISPLIHFPENVFLLSRSVYCQ